MKSIIVEAAVETLHSAVAAERAGAHRLELCAGLADGGTTPSAGLVASVVERVHVPVFVLIRPRGGHFVYSDDDLAIMRSDVELACTLSVGGIVTGVLTPDHRIDAERTRSLVEAAGGLPVTFHRAFDLVEDAGEALEQLVAAGVSRVLTSGGAARALDGAARIAHLVERAAGRIVVIAGGGIREDNVRAVVERARVTEVHTGVSNVVGSGGWPDASNVHLRGSLPSDEGAWREVDEERLCRLVEALRSLD